MGLTQKQGVVTHIDDFAGTVKCHIVYLVHASHVPSWSFKFLKIFTWSYVFDPCTHVVISVLDHAQVSVPLLHSSPTLPTNINISKLVNIIFLMNKHLEVFLTQKCMIFELAYASSSYWSLYIENLICYSHGKCGYNCSRDVLINYSRATR